jgi:hypothetical protein
LRERPSASFIVISSRARAGEYLEFLNREA